MAKVQTKIAVVGVRDTLRAIKKIDPEATKQLRNELNAAAKLIQVAAKKRVSNRPPLSGWNKIDAIRPRVRLGASTAPGWPAWKLIRSSIRVNKAATDRQRTTKTRTTVAVYSSNPAAIIYEFAKQSHTLNRFSAHLPSSRGGRTLWAGHDEVAGQVQRKITDALSAARKIIQASVDSAKV